MLEAGFDFCESLLQDIGVAVLPGAEFSCQKHELTVRMACVDFNGDMALKALRFGMCNGHGDEAFLRMYCVPVVDAVDKIENWLKLL